MKRLIAIALLFAASAAAQDTPQTPIPASLSIQEKNDGRVLVHCFAECDVEHVLSSVGLTFEALYHPRSLGEFKPERRPFPATVVLRAISHEVTIVAIAASTMAKGEALPELERERLRLASTRIWAAIEESNHA